MRPGAGFFDALLGGARPCPGAARRPTGPRRCSCVARGTATTPRSPSGCSTSPTPRASRRSRRSGRARRRTRWPAACGGSTCCASGCTPTRSASPASSRPAGPGPRSRGSSPVSRTRRARSELKAMVDEVLRGIAGSDFADVLLRAAAFARVVAAGRAALTGPEPTRTYAGCCALRAARGRGPRRAGPWARLTAARSRVCSGLRNACESFTVCPSTSDRGSPGSQN